MRDFGNLDTCELLALGRRAFEMGARRLDQIASAADPRDEALRGILRKMSLDSDLRAAEVEQRENVLPEECRLAASPEQAVALIRESLPSLGKSFGEGFLSRDAALFFAESLEEETCRLCRVLAQHSREWSLSRLFSELADREQTNLQYLRDVVLQG